MLKLGKVEDRFILSDDKNSVEIPFVSNVVIINGDTHYSEDITYDDKVSNGAYAIIMENIIIENKSKNHKQK